HFGELMLNRAEFGDGASERFTLFGIFERDGKNVFGSTHTQCTEFQPSDVEDIESDYVSTADFAQDIFDRNGHVLKIDGGSGRAFNAHLLFLGSACHTAEGALYQKRSKFFAADLRKYGEQ